MKYLNALFAVIVLAVVIAAIVLVLPFVFHYMFAYGDWVSNKLWGGY